MTNKLNCPEYTLRNLDSATIELTGRHLIEASAGTGKTYNITRIYLRLLLERELKVEQILLMTFTKDATQELKGRIDVFIRDALNNWPELCENDSYFKAIDQRVSREKILFLLKRALLFLDEAAIFTIHGFCQRTITQHAFATGLPFNATMSASSHDLVLTAVQDWYRQLAKSNSEGFSLVTQFWSTPNGFISSFSKAISHRHKLTLVDVQSIVNTFILLAKQARQAIIDNEPLIAQGLIAHKKVDETQTRTNELQKLLSWLNQISASEDETSLLNAISTPMPDYLLNGNRHPKAFKSQLTSVLAGAKDIKAKVNNLHKDINKAKAYQVVCSAIYQIRQQVIDSKQQLNTLDFDDLIHALATCLQTEENNHLAQTLLAQFPVALIDEFQDTDPQQFSILQNIYFANETLSAQQSNKPASALYLIGDPKQAIYGFRGGDIFAYLNARSDCQFHWLMDTNWRSTPQMIDAYNQLFLFAKQDGITDNSQSSQSVFGYGIDYQVVHAGKASKQTNEIKDSNKALQLIHFCPESGSLEEKVKQSTRPLMARWCANKIIELFKTEKVKPQDIAILVRDGSEARDIKQALLNANLASVFLSDRANLFHSLQAAQLISLLKGILVPEDERLYLSALACGLLGYNSQKLYSLQQNETAYQALKLCFIDYKSQWQRQGFITMAINLMHQHFDFSSFSSISDKDRALTNLLHLFEILQSASQRILDPQALVYWFEQQCKLDSPEAVNELETEQRLESDGNLIRIVTQHGAKGLEYPVVFIPFATRHKDPLKFGNKNLSYLEYHDAKGQLCLSLDGDEQAKRYMAEEAYAESIRLLYVAITRAENRCYLLSTSFDKYALSPLGKALQWQNEQDISKSLQSLALKSTQAINYEQIYFDSIAAKSFDSLQEESQLTQLAASTFKGKIERDWWLSSFSALSRNIRHGGVSTPDRDSMEHVGHDSTLNHTTKPQLRFELAKGAHSGNLLHDILEYSNFIRSDDSANNWRESIKWPLVKYGELTEGFALDDLISWLDEIITAPLIQTSAHSAEQVDYFCLNAIKSGKTLRESEFYFPMEHASISQLEKLLTDHRNLSSNSPNTTNANTVRLPSFKALKGMMHGFIDLIFEYEGKYYVCDYKSSHLGDTLSAYQHEDLRLNIEKNYYDLQYLIYSLALHRYLAEQISDYDAEVHFGGIFYLYLRGMSNDKSSRGTGVYYRNITEQELNSLDETFKGQSTSEMTHSTEGRC